MLTSLKRMFGKATDPIAYHVPLDWFEAQLPQDLLSSGLYWVWESVRAFPAVNPNLQAERRPTPLTAELAAALSAEIGEYYLESHRELTAFATAGPLPLRPTEIQKAIRAFADSGSGPLVAILYQPPVGASEVFVPRATPDAMAQLLTTWTERLGKPLERAEGGEMLRWLFLNSK